MCHIVDWARGARCVMQLFAAHSLQYRSLQSIANYPCGKIMERSACLIAYLFVLSTFHCLGQELAGKSVYSFYTEMDGSVGLLLRGAVRCVRVRGRSAPTVAVWSTGLCSRQVMAENSGAAAGQSGRIACDRFKIPKYWPFNLPICVFKWHKHDIQTDCNNRYLKLYYKKLRKYTA